MRISNGRMVTGNTQKTNGISKILIVGIIICTVLIIGIVALMLYMQTSVLKLYVDGQTKSIPEGAISVDKETGKMSISLQDFAKILGYQYNNGEYNIISEDTDKCYIQTSDETASFFVNSNIIYKSPITKERNIYEYYDLGDIVRKEGDKLYTNKKGAELGYDINIEYDAKKNSIYVYTLPYLVEYYKTEVTKWGYEYDLDEDDLENRKAVLYGFLVVKKAEESSNKSEKVGVINTKNEEIFGIKYDKLVYNENTNEFFAYDDDKVGLVSVDGNVLIPIKYEDIQVLDKDLELYVVINNRKKGVANKKGEYVMYAEYDEIGIKSTDFANDKIVNPYLLMGEVIPAQKNQKWGLFDKKGNQILPMEYDEIGCNGTNSKNSEATNSLLIIPNYKAIVLKKNDKYGIYNTKGVELVQCALDSAYSTSKGGVNTYYMVYNGQVMNIAEYLNKFMPEATSKQEEEQVDEQQGEEQQDSGEQVDEQQGREQQDDREQVDEQQGGEQQDDEEQIDEQQGGEQESSEEY